MSVIVMGQVWQTDLPANHKITLLAYADHASDDGTSIYPGEDRMATKTSYSGGNVRRITAELIEEGLLERIAKGHRGQRAVYRIDVDALNARVEKARNMRALEETKARTQTPKGAHTGEERRAHSAGKARAGATPNHQEPSGTIRTIIPAQAPNRARNHGWDFVTNPAGPFGLPAQTPKQKRRVGALADDINGTLDHHAVADEDRPTALYTAARSWPRHFENATLTADAFAKHLPALLRAPLKATPEHLHNADEEAAIAELESRKRKALT